LPPPHRVCVLHHTVLRRARNATFVPRRAVVAITTLVLKQAIGAIKTLRPLEPLKH